MKKICIIIVTYNPDIINFTENIKEVSKFPGQVVVIDNNSDIEKQKKLELLSKKLTFKLYKLNHNLGIGYAQNYVIRKFHESNYYFFLDQDSYVTVKQFNKIVHEFVNLEKIDNKVAALGPTIFNNTKSIKKVSKVEKIASSGSIISRVAFENIGLMEEKFFIDFVDFEWCWRAIYKGWHIYQSNDIKIMHETAGINRKNGHTVDPIFRLFYIYRNATYIVLYKRIYAKIKIKLIVKLLGKFLFQISLNDRKKRITTCLLGVKNGIRKKFKR